MSKEKKAPEAREGEGPTPHDLLYAQHADPNKGPANPELPEPPEPLDPPVISAVVPEDVIVGSADIDLQVTGTGFVDGSVIAFDGANVATTFVSATELTTPISPALAPPGLVEVIVKNPDGQNSVASEFEFVAPVGDDGVRKAGKRRR